MNVSASQLLLHLVRCQIFHETKAMAQYGYHLLRLREI